MNNWRAGGVDVGDIVRIDDGEFEHRLGYGWARGRLKHGDLLLAVHHGGDCFYDYILLDHTEMTLEGVTMLRVNPIPVPFGAYTLGRNIGRVDFEQLRRLQAGESLSIAMPETYATPELSAIA